MTSGQYRALIAYMQYWPKRHPQFGLEAGIRDIGITDSKSDVITEFRKAGWVYEEKTGILRYQG
jgi:hypothetical protein